MFEVLRIITLTLRIFMIVTKVRSVQINEFIHVTEKLFMNTRYQINQKHLLDPTICVPQWQTMIVNNKNVNKMTNNESLLFKLRFQKKMYKFSENHQRK